MLQQKPKTFICNGKMIINQGLLILFLFYLSLEKPFVSFNGCEKLILQITDMQLCSSWNAVRLEIKIHATNILREVANPPLVYCLNSHSVKNVS